MEKTNIISLIAGFVAGLFVMFLIDPTKGVLFGIVVIIVGLLLARIMKEI